MTVYPIAAALHAGRDQIDSARPDAPVVDEPVRTTGALRRALATVLERSASVQLRAAGRLRPAAPGC